MNSKSFTKLQSLQSLRKEHIPFLNQIGIETVGDLLNYNPIKYAKYVVAASLNELTKEEILRYIDASASHLSAERILSSSPSILRKMGIKESKIFAEKLGIHTVEQLAHFPPYNEAEELMNHIIDEIDPSAPGCLVPECKKFTKSKKRYTSFYRRNEINNLPIRLGKCCNDILSPLFAFSDCPPTIFLGYALTFQQTWTYTGIHLGEPLGSVPLFMGQDSRISIIDWKRVNQGFRFEDTRQTERLRNVFTHQRAVDEVARATAEEHQHGATSIFGANAAASGSFVTAGAIVGGVGGGISSAIAGLVLGNVANVAGGAPTIGGAIAGTAIGSAAGAAAASLVVSGATTLGFIENEAEGNREVFSQSAQNIQERTMQNSSDLRSFWSNIVTQTIEEESQTLNTSRVTNYNKIHALNAIYFEVLNEYLVTLKRDDFSPILFLPFKPIKFNLTSIARHWWLLRRFILDTKLKETIDNMIGDLNIPDNTPEITLEDLPQIDDITAGSTFINLRLSDSLLETIAKIPFEGGIIAFIIKMINKANIQVFLVSTEGTSIQLNQFDVDGQTIKFRTFRNLDINKFSKIRIKLNSFEFFGLNNIDFSSVRMRIQILNRSDLESFIPDIGILENNKLLKTSFNLSAQNDVNIDLRSSYNAILDRLYEQVELLRRRLEALIDEELNEERSLQKLIGLLNSNKFLFTRLILENTEPEQLSQMLDCILIGDIPLNSIAQTLPIGFNGGHILLPMKSNQDIRECTQHFTDIINNALDIKQLTALVTSVKTAKELNAAVNSIEQIINRLKKEILRAKKESSSCITLISEEGIIEQLTDIELGLRNRLDQVKTLKEKLKILVQFPSMLNVVFKNLVLTGNERNTLLTFTDTIIKEFDKPSKTIITDKVSLPTPAVFMEPVLSRAKGAEKYDLTRNSHYELLQSPDILGANPNIDRNENIDLTANRPDSTLNIINPPQNPLPNLTSFALAEAGKLDLSTIISSNTNALSSTLSDLSSLATELAKASSNLAGNAAEEALKSATEIGKQVGNIIESSLANPPSTQAPTPPPPPSPSTLPEKGAVINEIEKIDKAKISKQKKKERKKTIGASVTPSNELEYQIGISFLDAENRPLQDGNFKLSLSSSQLAKENGEGVIVFNGGASLELGPNQFFLPETIRLEKNRNASITIISTINGIQIDGLFNFILPNKQDLTFIAKVDSTTERIIAKTVKEAVDKTIKSKSFAIEAGLMFEKFLSGSVSFPYKIVEIALEAGIKNQLDIKGEYKADEQNEQAGTAVNSNERVFEVTIPKNNFIIEII